MRSILIFILASQLHFPVLAQEEAPLSCENEKTKTVSLVSNLLDFGKKIQKKAVNLYYQGLLKKYDLQVVPRENKFSDKDVEELVKKGGRVSQNILQKSDAPLDPREIRESRNRFPLRLRWENVYCLRKVLEELDAKINPGSTVLFLGRSPSLLGDLYERRIKKRAGKILYLAYSGAPDIINPKRFRDPDYSDTKNLVTAEGLHQFFDYLDAKGMDQTKDLTVVDGIGSGAGLMGLLKILKIYDKEHLNRKKPPRYSFLGINSLMGKDFKNSGIWDYDEKRKILQFQPGKDVLPLGMIKRDIPARYLENDCLADLIVHFDNDRFQSHFGRVSESFHPYQWEALPLLRQSRKSDEIEKPGRYYQSATTWFAERVLDPIRYDEGFNTLLHQMVMEEEKEEDLIKKWEGDSTLLFSLNEGNLDGDTPLHLAVKAKKIQVARDLISRGADPELKNWQGQSPFHLALKSGAPDMVELFLNLNIDREARTDHGEHPLFLSVGNPQFDESHFLRLAEGIEVASLVSGEKGWSLAHLAVLREDPRMLKIIFQAVKTKEARARLANLGEEEKNTPLHFVFANFEEDSADLLECVKILLQQGAAWGAKNQGGKSPLDMAKKFDDFELKKYFPPL